MATLWIPIEIEIFSIFLSPSKIVYIFANVNPWDVDLKNNDRIFIFCHIGKTFCLNMPSKCFKWITENFSEFSRRNKVSKIKIMRFAMPFIQYDTNHAIDIWLNSSGFVIHFLWQLFPNVSLNINCNNFILIEENISDHQIETIKIVVLTLNLNNALDF